MSVPWWFRALKRADRLVWYAFHGYEVTRDEVMLAWLDASERDAVIDQAYREQRVYLPGGATFERGLFSWEKSLLARDEIPRSGRVLLAAAGGGRELKALIDRGYEVLAFEPNPVLRVGAESVARADPTQRAKVYDGVFADLSRATQGDGPLAALQNRGPFDLVVLGWGSITHVLDASERASLLRSVKLLAPAAPVICSFFLRPDVGYGGRTEQLRRALRRTFAALGAPNRDVSPGLAYESGGGFVYAFSESEVQALAHEAGYSVPVLESHPFPHALLLPHER